MKMLKQMIQNTGLMLLGAMSILLIVFVLAWEALKLVGRVIVWFIDMKIQEKYPKDEE